MSPYLDGRVLLVVALALFGSSVRAARADSVTYQFTTTVLLLNTSAPNFPASLSGLSVGAAISGTISYDPTSPAAANPFSGLFGDATLYQLQSASVAFNVGGVTFGTGAEPFDETLLGTLNAFVWDNDAVGGGDGLDFTNFAGTGTNFQIGNLNLPTGTFADESLPGGDIPGTYVFDMRSGASPAWFTSSGFQLERVSPVPTPTAAVGGLSLAAFIAARRRRQLLDC